MFLISAILQCIPIICQIGPEITIPYFSLSLSHQLFQIFLFATMTTKNTVIPIAIVLRVSIVREGIEDLVRAKLDRKQNSEPTEVYMINQWEQTHSGKLYMGGIVSVKQDDTFLADLILIDSDLSEGIWFIETGSLDGEKILKLKEFPKEKAEKFNKKGERYGELMISGNAKTN